MYIFTYKDYLNCLKHKDEIEAIKKKLEEKYKKEQNKDNSNYQNNEENKTEEEAQNNTLNEDTEKYIVPNGILNNTVYINNKHDKIFRKILDDKKEASKLINEALELKNKIAGKDIEKYNSSFVTDKLRNEESDIIYKLKNRNIFFLIEHQTKIDYAMSLRMLEYQIEIIKSAINIKEKNKKGYKFPIVMSIVLYTGKKKWDSKTYLKEAQEKLEGYEGLEIGRYNIVDVNDYTEEELLKDESFLTKAMLIEKAEHSKNLEENLRKIVKEVNSKEEVYTKEQKELLKTIIVLALGTKVDNSLKEELVKELNKEEKNMLAVLDMLEEENKKLIRQGKIQGRKEGIRKGIKVGIKQNVRETAKKMLQKKIDTQTVMEITGLTEKEIIKLNASNN